MMKYRPAMLRTFRHTMLLCAVLLTAACSKEKTPAPRLELSAAEVVLRGGSGSEAAVTVTANGAWELTVTGSGFDITPVSGSRGETVVTLTATQENTQRTRRTLGSVAFRPTAGKGSAAARTLEVCQSPATAPRTMLLYMPGRSLLSFYNNNIDGIRRAVSAQVPGDGRILVCYQPEGQQTASLQEVRYDFATGGSVVETLKEYASFTAAAPQSLAEMFADVAEYAPAEEYGLIVGCHGKAWVPTIAGSLYASGMQLGTQPGGAAVSDNLWQPLPDAKPTRSFGDTGYEIDIADFAAVIEALPYRFDYLIFDACFMANIETLYDLRAGFDYIVASPCEIMAAGFPYDRTVPYLFTGERIGDRLSQVCRAFWDFYQNDWQSVPNNEQSGCISLCVTAALDGRDGRPGLDDVTRRLYAAARQTFDLNTLQSYEGLATHLFYDLGHYVSLSCVDAALLDEFRMRFDEAFPAESRLNTPSFYSAYNGRLNPITSYSGVSTSKPAQRLQEYYEQTAWDQATNTR